MVIVVRKTIFVAPFMGAWIEISSRDWEKIGKSVAPFMGAWIEINAPRMSVPSNAVAPFMGAWIEISFSL